MEKQNFMIQMQNVKIIPLKKWLYIKLKLIMTVQINSVASIIL